MLKIFGFNEKWCAWMKVCVGVLCWYSSMGVQQNKLILKERPNTFLGPLSFTFVSDKSFKFLKFQIGPLSFEFVSDRSFCQPPLSQSCSVR